MPTPKGCTLTIIFEAQSLNYDEGYGGNLSVLKKLHRGNGEVYSYSSRQSIRYSIFNQGIREFNWKPSEVKEAGSGDKKVTQLISSIQESEESDLFGYMQTNKKINDTDKEVTVSRTSPVRILPAISLEPYNSDMEMLTNKYQSDKKNLQPNIAVIENQRSFYRYTLCIDLHRIGTENDQLGSRVSPNGRLKAVDEEFRDFIDNFRKVDLNNERKIQRVSNLLDIIVRLYRDIRGRREDLKPLFVIGGIYSTFNPFFENIVNITWDITSKKYQIDMSPLNQILDEKYNTTNSSDDEKSIKQDTFIGIREGIFSTSAKDFEQIYDKNVSNQHIGSPEFVVSQLKNQIKEYYK